MWYDSDMFWVYLDMEPVAILTILDLDLDLDGLNKV